MRAEAGFTLIEALVALVILALASVALLGAGEAHVRNVAELESRAIAQWVAENRLVELSLARGRAQETPVSTEMLGREWRVSMIMKPTSDPELAEVEIRVAEPDATQPLVIFGGFLDTGAAPF